MITSAIKKQTSVCCSISLNPYMVFQTLILLIIVLNKVLIKNKLTFVQFTIPYSEKFW